MKKEHNCNNGWIEKQDGLCWCDCKIQQMKSCIGKLYQDCTLETLTLFSYQKKAKKILENPKGSYFLLGNFGKGKTYIMACQYDWFLKKYRRPIAKYFREVDLVENWQDWENERCYTKDELKDLQHFFLDDIGRSKYTERIGQEMYSLIDWIYTNQIGLTVSSNYSYKELTSIYGGAIVRRIKDICEIIEIKEVKDDKET